MIGSKLGAAKCRWVAAGVLSFALFAGTGCGGGSSEPGPVPTFASASSTFQSVRFTLTADNKPSSGNHVVYNQGETASFAFTITNESAGDVAFLGGQFPAQIVVTRDGTEVWRVQYVSEDVSDGQVDTTPDTTSIPRLVHPGEALDYHLRWPLVDQRGNRVPPGEYEAVAWFQTTDGVNGNFGGQYQTVNARTDLTSGRLAVTVR